MRCAFLQNVCLRVQSTDFFLLIQVSKIKLILPGSFNPLHEGHISILERASRLQGLSDESLRNGQAVFEISVHNADKGIIDEDQLLGRISRITDIGSSVIVTSSHPTFVSKAQVSTIARSCARSTIFCNLMVYYVLRSSFQDGVLWWDLILQLELSIRSTTKTDLKRCCPRSGLFMTTAGVFLVLQWLLVVAVCVGILFVLHLPMQAVSGWWSSSRT